LFCPRQRQLQLRMLTQECKDIKQPFQVTLPWTGLIMLYKYFEQQDNKQLFLSLLPIARFQQVCEKWRRPLCVALK
jgi:hypothetical protein